ncbi:MAG: DUF1579 domain-containing protein [Myxococcota bacterium]|nr:DUF1579 domain-containing protein [Myxococcota bacterium]
MSSADAATAPFTAGPEHEHLRRFVGRWTGTVALWLDPSAPPEETTATAQVDALLGGRFVRVEYAGVAMGTPNAGQYLLAYERDEHRYTAAWIDSFHTGTAMMISTAPGLVEDELSVLGSYVAGDQRWGWRTSFRATADALVIATFNITPDGAAARAFEMRFTRA